jgi:hypothetical protein
LAQAATSRLSDTAGTSGRHLTGAQIVARLRRQRCHRPPIGVQLISTIEPAITVNGDATPIRLPLAGSPSGQADRCCRKYRSMRHKVVGMLLFHHPNLGCGFCRKAAYRCRVSRRGNFHPNAALIIMDHLIGHSCPNGFCCLGTVSGLDWLREPRNIRVSASPCAPIPRTAMANVGPFRGLHNGSSGNDTGKATMLEHRWAKIMDGVAMVAAVRYGDRHISLARSLRSVAASLSNLSISSPTAAASVDPGVSQPSLRNSCLRWSSVSDETFPLRRSRWSSAMNWPAAVIRAA